MRSRLISCAINQFIINGISIDFRSLCNFQIDCTFFFVFAFSPFVRWRFSTVWNLNVNFRCGCAKNNKKKMLSWLRHLHRIFACSLFLICASAHLNVLTIIQPMIDENTTKIISHWQRQNFAASNRKKIECSPIDDWTAANLNKERRFCMSIY